MLFFVMLYILFFLLSVGTPYRRYQIGWSVRQGYWAVSGDATEGLSDTGGVPRPLRHNHLPTTPCLRLAWRQAAE
jgi:hypothetical protein